MNDEGSRKEAREPEIELMRFAVTGSGPEWERLTEALFQGIETCIKKLQGPSGTDAAGSSACDQALQDMASIAMGWLQAKVEKPGLQNAQIRSEILQGFAEAKKRFAEARKIEAEAEKIERETAFADLEKYFRLVNLANSIRAQRVGRDMHLAIGVDTTKLAIPPSSEVGDR